MKVILGLGNPGREYEHTRHNVGWWVLDHLADVWRFDGWRKDGEAMTSTGVVRGLKVRLVKPLTYMNLSGQVLRPYLRRPFWAAKSDLLVIVDDVAIPVGTYRIRAKGSAGGHNGLKSVEHHLKTQDYPRLRIGVGPGENRSFGGDLADFVLSKVGKQEEADIRALMETFVGAVETWLVDGVEVTMNRYNGGK